MRRLLAVVAAAGMVAEPNRTNGRNEDPRTKTSTASGAFINVVSNTALHEARRRRTLTPCLP